MSNLKSIVPPLELCKQIPAGEFEDTALVFRPYRMKGDEEVCQREEFDGFDEYRIVPAPTLEEILEAIGEVETWDTATITRPIGVNARIVDTALKRWFKVKGIQCE